MNLESFTIFSIYRTGADVSRNTDSPKRTPGDDDHSAKQASRATCARCLSAISQNERRGWLDCRADLEPDETDQLCAVSVLCEFGARCLSKTNFLERGCLLSRTARSQRPNRHKKKMQPEKTRAQRSWRCAWCGLLHKGFENSVCRNSDCDACDETVRLQLIKGKAR